MIFKAHLYICVQSFLKHKDAKPLRDVLASNPNRFVPLLVPAGTAATVRPGSPSTTTARLDLQFQAIKVCNIAVKMYTVDSYIQLHRHLFASSTYTILSAVHVKSVQKFLMKWKKP